jgi:hypothetical protein
MSEPLTDEWRRKHVEKGDEAMSQVYTVMGDLGPDGLGLHSMAAVSLYVSVAQAHYLAANVRARPQVS